MTSLPAAFNKLLLFELIVLSIECNSVFIEKLPDELKDEFDELIDSHLDLLPLELEQNFIDGFRIGVRMMTEVYAAPLDEEEHS